MLAERIKPEIFVGLREPRQERALKLIQHISNFDMDTIIERVCKLHNLTPEQIKSRSATGDIRHCRAVAIYLICKGGNYSLKQIGQRLGGRDHSTIISARDSIKEPAEVNRNFRDQIIEIQRKVCSGELA